MRLMFKNLMKMESLEIDFARIAREHKGTIYTVCYMFSKDEDEAISREAPVLAFTSAQYAIYGVSV